MSKKKRIMTIVITIICLIIAFVFTVKAINISKENNITSYLCEKYKWEEKDIEILNYQKGYWDYNIGFMDDSIYFNYINPKWEIKYKDRVFNTEYYHFHFADDYQLEDIFQWCTEYLQENVDPEIVGIEVCSDIIYHSSENRFDYDLPWDTKKVFSKKDAKELLTILSEVPSKKWLSIFYKVDNLLSYGQNIQSEHQHELYGNEKYNKFCKGKSKVFKSYYDNCDIKIALIDNVEFERRFASVRIYLLGEQESYSFNDNAGYYVKNF